MSIQRTSTAVWNGNGKNGTGHLSTASRVLDATPYGFRSRFESGQGTNPEELIAAAHAGCFAMKLAFNLQEAGHEPEELHVRGTVVLDEGSITRAHLVLVGSVSGLSAERFAELAEDAKRNCPVSRVLDAEITLEHSLQQPA